MKIYVKNNLILNTGFWLNTYEIISTGNDAGLVEMVNDSVS